MGFGEQADRRAVEDADQAARRLYIFRGFGAHFGEQQRQNVFEHRCRAGRIRVRKGRAFHPLRTQMIMPGRAGIERRLQVPQAGVSRNLCVNHRQKMLERAELLDKMQLRIIILIQ